MACRKEKGQSNTHAINCQAMAQVRVQAPVQIDPQVYKVSPKGKKEVFGPRDDTKITMGT